MNLEEKLYTSTEVGEILGVSLRSVYRYLEQGKLDAEIKTATGRLRFTRQNILDFLYPEGEASPSVVTKAAATSQDESKEPEASLPEQEKKEEPAEQQEVPESEVEDEEEVQEQPKEEEEEEIDWLERFRAAAREYSQEDKSEEDQEEEPEEESPEDTAPVSEEEPEGLSSLTSDEEEPASSIKYYKSMVGGLKEIAQNLDRVARKSNVDYAFTLFAGLSLERPLKKPFSILHAYISEESEPLFVRMLQLEESDKDNAQLCLMFPKQSSVFAEKQEKHGLYVVSDDCMKEDFVSMGISPGDF